MNQEFPGQATIPPNPGPAAARERRGEKAISQQFNNYHEDNSMKAENDIAKYAPYAGVTGEEQQLIEAALPKEALARLNAEEGDTVTLTDAPEGGLRVTPATAGREQFAKQMKAAEVVIRRYRNTLRELAK